MSINIVDRFILILKEQMTPQEADDIYRSEGLAATLLVMFSNRKFAGRGFWERLADKTDIPSQSWRGAYMRRQKPTPEMIEIVGKLWPKYAFWLTTGITDISNGHTAPMTVMTYPEKSHVENYWSNQYFHLAISINHKLNETADPKDTATWLTSPIKIEKMITKWKGSDYEKCALDLANSDTYQTVVECWKKREENRVEHIEKLCSHPNNTHNAKDWDIFYKTD